MENVIRSKEHIAKCFENKTFEQISAFLTELSGYFTISNSNKNDHKAVFLTLLDYILSNNLPISEMRTFLSTIRVNLLNMAIEFPECLDEFMIGQIILIEKKVNKKKSENEKEDENNYDEDYLQNLINLSLLVIAFTENLSQTNQILSNFLMLLGMLINKMSNRQLITKVFFIEITHKISVVIKCYNPNLINQLESALFYIDSSIPSSLDIYENLNYRDFQMISIDNNSQLSTLKIFCFVFQKLLSIIENLLKAWKDDMNVDYIFMKILQMSSGIESKIRNSTTEHIDQIIIDDNENILRRSIALYKSFCLKCIEKKSIPMNYLIIKPKPIPSLEPLYDLSFLGDNPEFVNETAKKERISHAIEKKLKSTKKQAIRKLKKEARIIDTQRQEELKIISDKRKEDLKISNQFIEEQNMEYKKLMTSQNKKRYKIKKKRVQQKFKK